MIVSSYSARGISIVVNFFLNKNKVFKISDNDYRTLIKYLILCFIQITLSAYGMKLLHCLMAIDWIVLKIIVDTILFMSSFHVQRKWVFKR